MLSLGLFAFASPWLLAGIALLPVLWRLLRVTPPTPAVVRFPAIRILAGLDPAEETPARTPLWLLLLRMLLALLLILALAHPLLNPPAGLPGTGPLVLAVDNGWAAASDWPARQRAMTDLISAAGRQGREVVLLPTAAGGPQDPASLTAADQAQALAERVHPEPWPTDRAAAARRLASLPAGGDAAVYWLSDGLDDAGVGPLADRLRRLGEVRVMLPAPGRLPALLAPGDLGGTALGVAVRRAPIDAAATASLRALGLDGALLGTGTARFASGAAEADAALDLPVELRNRVERVVLDGPQTAGSVLLLDNRAHRRSVGIVAARAAGSDQPLLSPTYYVDRALQPYADLARGGLVDLLRRPRDMLVLPDGDAGSAGDRKALSAWVDAGGVLLRFAGPALAAADDDGLLPVALRQGGRSIGGAMSWETPAHLAAFPSRSPFAGLPVPAEVTVARQVLAEPSVDLTEKTWARLSDGTPLVTAAQRGKGWIVLFHTTSNADWSNLALSGLFVDMLRRLADLGSGGDMPADTVLPPWRTLDDAGALQAPPAAATPVTAGTLAATRIGPAHPPGYYGTEEVHRSLNLAGSVPDLAALVSLPTGLQAVVYAGAAEIDLRPFLLAAVLALALIDLVVGYGLRGLLRFAVVTLSVLALGAGTARADDARTIEATSALHLAYVVTGDPDVDAVSKAGLAGLGAVLGARTSVETAAPMGVDPETDDLIFFPFVYWPITDGQKPLSATAVARVNQYLATGGTLLIDTRDQGLGMAGSNTAQRLSTLLAGVHIPALVPMPASHVLSHTFYLLDDFPGRWDGGTIWVEPSDDRVNDGVSSLVVGSNDWASAWAVDGSGAPEFPVSPGNDAQRELAYRFGVNLVMYALTGNYKADQLQVKALLDRLGR
jgi:hypothetical protein